MDSEAWEWLRGHWAIQEQEGLQEETAGFSSEAGPGTLQHVTRPSSPTCTGTSFPKHYLQTHQQTD